MFDINPSPVTLPSLNHESALLNRAITEDMKRLQYDAAKFNFQEGQKEALRKDYEWQNKLQVDEITDNFTGGILQSLNSIDPNDPEARGKFREAMSKVPHELYDNKAIQSAFQFNADEISKAENKRENEIGMFKTSALAMANEAAKNGLTNDLGLSASKLLAKANNLDDIEKIATDLRKESTGRHNESNVNMLNSSYFSGGVLDFSSDYDPRPDATPADKVVGVLKAIGQDFDPKRIQEDPLYFAELLPIAANHLENRAVNATKLAALDKKDLASLKDDGRRILADAVQEENKKLTSMRRNGVKPDVIKSVEENIKRLTGKQATILKSTNPDEIYSEISQALGEPVYEETSNPGGI